jgi:GT2 family glycosyltransferase
MDLLDNIRTTSNSAPVHAGSTASLCFVIVSWNAKDYLLQCLDSIYKNLADRSAQVMVVDNASTDDSVSAVRQHYPQVKVIEPGKNLGFARANNIGIQHCTGEYIFLVNSDVIILPDCIDRLCEYLSRNPSVGLVSPRILNADGTLQPSYRATPGIGNSLIRALALDSLPIIPRILGKGLRKKQIASGQLVDITSGCFWVARRSAVDKVGMLDEDFFFYGEDKDWCVRFWKANFEVVYLPDAEAIHFGGASSSRQPVRFYIEQHRANLHYWKKHHGPLGQLAIRFVMLLHQAVRVAVGVVALPFFAFSQGRRQRILHTINRCYCCARFLLGDTSYLKA